MKHRLDICFAKRAQWNSCCDGIESHLDARCETSGKHYQTRSHGCSFLDRKPWSKGHHAVKEPRNPSMVPCVDTCIHYTNENWVWACRIQIRIDINLGNNINKKVDTELCYYLENSILVAMATTLDDERMSWHRLHSLYLCTKYETWKLKTLGVRVRTGTNGWTDRRTDGRPVSHNTPRYIYRAYKKVW